MKITVKTPTEKQIEVMQHFADEGSVEFTEILKAGEEWKYWPSPTNYRWNWEKYIYRIVMTKPSIDWSHVSQEYNYLAEDENGEAYLYTDRPELDVDDVLWSASEGSVCGAEYFASFEPGDCSFQDSLVKRPND